MAGPGYDIGASLANNSASQVDPFEEAGTVFIFGNADNPNLSAEQIPSQTATATATTALPGGVATSTVPISTNAPGAALAAVGASSLGGISTTTWIILAVVGYVVLKHFEKK